MASPSDHPDAASIRLERRGDLAVAVVAAPRNFDARTEDATWGLIDAALRQGVRGVVFDLTGTAYLSSSGLRVIVQTLHRKEAKSRIRLAAARPAVAEVLRLARVDAMVSSRPTVAEALDEVFAAAADD